MLVIGDLKELDLIKKDTWCVCWLGKVVEVVIGDDVIFTTHCDNRFTAEEIEELIYLNFDDEITTDYDKRALKSLLEINYLGDWK